MPPEHKLDFELFGSEYFAIRGYLIGQLSTTANAAANRPGKAIAFTGPS